MNSQDDIFRQPFGLITLVLTDACNFSCSYCIQKRSDRFLPIKEALAFLDFIFPHLKEESVINFYGGEPLLAFSAIEPIVKHVRKKEGKFKKKIKFGISTNGSLLTKETIGFFSRHDFSLIFSFDGLAQDKGRQKGSFDRQVKMLQTIKRFPGLKFNVNSVFAPETVGLMEKSIAFIHELGVKDIILSLDMMHAWKEDDLELLKEEMTRLVRVSRDWLKNEGGIPLTGFRPRKGKGIFTCGAGRDRLSVRPDGRIWGCHLFADYYLNRGEEEIKEKFSFGMVDDFLPRYNEIYPKVIANYGDFRQDLFFTQSRQFCFLCKQLRRFCGACPAISGIDTGTIALIPDWFCKVKDIEYKAYSSFQRSHKTKSRAADKEF